MSNSLPKLIKGMLGDTMRLNRKMISFFFCLLASVFFWFVSVFSKKYTTTIDIPVSYVNVPSGKVISGQLPKNISIRIRSTGFRIALFQFFNKVASITIDIKDMRSRKNGFYLATTNKFEDVSAQLVSEFEIIKIYPDTLFFSFNDRVEKIVPIKLNIEIDYEKQFSLSDSIRVSPNAIQISGSADVVNKIDFVETEKLSIVKAKEPISKKINLKRSSKGVEYSTAAVNVSIPVAQFTEGVIESPIEIINLPNDFSIKTFPDKVNLRYMVAYENYNKIRPEMFKVVVDYEKIELNSNRLKVETKNFPTQYIRESTIRVNPEKVEYIIRKK